MTLAGCLSWVLRRRHTWVVLRVFWRQNTAFQNKQCIASCDVDDVVVPSAALCSRLRNLLRCRWRFRADPVNPPRATAEVQQPAGLASCCIRNAACNERPLNDETIGLGFRSGHVFVRCQLMSAASSSQTSRGSRWLTTLRYNYGIRSACTGSKAAGLTAEVVPKL